jgi:hypothetical protein
MLPIGSPMHNYRRSSDLLFGFPEHTKISSSCGETLNLPMSPERTRSSSPARRIIVAEAASAAAGEFARVVPENSIR